MAKEGVRWRRWRARRAGGDGDRTGRVAGVGWGSGMDCCVKGGEVDLPGGCSDLGAPGMLCVKAEEYGDNFP